MKYFLATLIMCFACSITFAQANITIGMSINDVRKKYPGMEATTYQHTTTLSRNEDLHGLKGSWGYRFEAEKLNWIHFQKYVDSINSENFQKCLKAAKQIIKDYTRLYGRPDTTILGNSTFIDPYKKKHWGYDVIEARWKDYKGMKIKVEFTFMGGKGVYQFLVSINYFDKTYPYYD